MRALRRTAAVDPEPSWPECTLGFGAHPSSGVSGHGGIDMRRGKPFPAPEHPVPIDCWQDSLLEQPGQTRRAGAIDDPFGESRKEFSAVTELREDNAPAFDRQWTRSVAVINGSRLLGVDDVKNVLRYARRLLAGRRG